MLCIFLYVEPVVEAIYRLAVLEVGSKKPFLSYPSGSKYPHIRYLGPKVLR